MTRRRWPWFFILICAFSSGIWQGPDFQKVPMGDSVWARLLPLTGLALGAIWQLVDRRDLTNRLTVAAVLVVLLLLLHAGFGGGYVHVPGVSAGLGLVAGLVLTEQWLRRANARQEQLDKPRAARTTPE